MDIESLKLVLETVNNAGADMKWVALAYIIAPQLSVITGWSGILLIVWWIRGMLWSLIDANRELRKIAVKLGMTVAGPWLSADTDCVLVKLDELLDGRADTRSRRN